jgi:hypothetical protein
MVWAGDLLPLIEKRQDPGRDAGSVEDGGHWPHVRFAETQWCRDPAALTLDRHGNGEAIELEE